MTNLSSNKPIKNVGDTMKYYLLSEQDIKEIIWNFEIFISTLVEKLSEKEVKEEE